MVRERKSVAVATAWRIRSLHLLKPHSGVGPEGLVVHTACRRRTGRANTCRSCLDQRSPVMSGLGRIVNGYLHHLAVYGYVAHAENSQRSERPQLMT